jgi:hypothetical protein
LGPLETDNLKHTFEGAQLSKCLPPRLKTETDRVSETSCLLVSRILDDEKKDKKTVILSIIHHRQNPLESTDTGLSDFVHRPDSK